MSSANQEIKIIGPSGFVTSVQSLGHLPLDTEGLGPEQHSLRSFFTKKSVSHLESEVDDLIGKLNGLVRRFASVAISEADKVELDEITIGLALSVEGDIGLASAGAEASIELKFKLKR
jgi:hypothetical protein